MRGFRFKFALSRCRLFFFCALCFVVVTPIHPLSIFPACIFVRRVLRCLGELVPESQFGRVLALLLDLPATPSTVGRKRRLALSVNFTRRTVPPPLLLLLLL